MFLTFTCSIEGMKIRIIFSQYVPATRELNVNNADLSHVRTAGDPLNV